MTIKIVLYFLFVFIISSHLLFYSLFFVCFVSLLYLFLCLYYMNSFYVYIYSIYFYSVFYKNFFVIYPKCFTNEYSFFGSKNSQKSVVSQQN